MSYLSPAEQLAFDKARLSDRMAEHDEGCIVAGRHCGMGKDRAGHVFRKIKKDLGAQAV